MMIFSSLCVISPKNLVIKLIWFCSPFGQFLMKKNCTFVSLSKLVGLDSLSPPQFLLMKVFIYFLLDIVDVNFIFVPLTGVLINFQLILKISMFFYVSKVDLTPKMKVLKIDVELVLRILFLLDQTILDHFFYFRIFKPYPFKYFRCSCVFPESSLELSRVEIEHDGLVI